MCIKVVKSYYSIVTDYVMNEGMDWASGQKNDGDSNPEVNIKSTQMSSVVDTTERKKSQANDHAILSLSNEANSSRKGKLKY